MEVPFSLFAWCFVFGMVGFAIHVLVKVVKENESAKAANVEFKFLEYLNADKWPLILNLVCLFAAVMCVDLVIGYNPSLIRTLKYFFLPLGFMGSSVFISILGKYSKAILNVVDLKTNIADGGPASDKLPTQ